MSSSRLNLHRLATGALALHTIPVLLVGLTLVSNASAQNMLRITPAQSSAEMGVPDVALDLEIDFAEVTAGGGVEVTYDATRLEFVSFTFSGDPNFGLTGPADGDPTQPLSIGAGWAVFEPPFGVSGLHTIGTFLFRAIESGSAAVITAESPNNPGPYFSAADTTPLVVSYGSATVQVAAAAVPALDVVGRVACCALLFLMGIRMLNRREPRQPCSPTGTQ